MKQPQTEPEQLEFDFDSIETTESTDVEEGTANADSK